MAQLSSKTRKSILKREERLRQSGDWGPWQIVPPCEVEHTLYRHHGWIKDVRTVYRNHVFTILERADTSGVLHIGIASLSGIRPTWYEMQRIKDELYGPEKTGVEIYPPAEDIVDGSDMFHIWILPGDIPFGLTKINASRGATTPAGELLLSKSIK